MACEHTPVRIVAVTEEDWERVRDLRLEILAGTRLATSRP
jgi:hypothetical protein